MGTVKTGREDSIGQLSNEAAVDVKDAELHVLFVGEGKGNG
jgi:hypothetical protein